MWKLGRVGEQVLVLSKCEFSRERATNTLLSRMAVYYNTPINRQGKKPQKPS